jgi:hypothetical protein
MQLEVTVMDIGSIHKQHLLDQATILTFAPKTMSSQNFLEMSLTQWVDTD